MKHQPFTPTSTSTIVLPELAQLLQVRRAVSEGDDAMLSDILARAADPANVHQQIHDAVGYQLREDRRIVHRIPEHSILWMVPIVTAPGCRVDRRTIPEMNDWVRGWFGASQRVTTLGALLDYGEAACLSPGKVQRLLETLARVRSSSFAMLQGDLFHASEPVVGLPSLQFLVGATTQAWEPPFVLEQPAGDRYALRERLVGALQFAAGEETPPAAAYTLGTPAGYCDAIVQGLGMWLREVDTYCHVDHWSVDPATRGLIDLSMVVEPNFQPARRLTLQMQEWHLGGTGLQEIISACPSGPLTAAAVRNNGQSAEVAR